MQPDLSTLVRSRGGLRAVARAARVPHPTLASWLSGKHTPHPDRLAVIVAKLEAMPVQEDGRKGRWTRKRLPHKLVEQDNNAPRSA